MKMQQISEHIWSIKIWIIIPLTVWMVVDADGVTLVDTGIPLMTKGIRERIAGLQAGPLQRILLTHGHPDHVGALNGLVQSQPVPVYAHAIEIPYINGDRPYPERKKPQADVTKGLVQPLAEEQGALAKVAGLKPYWTPGHAPGHVVYYHEQDQVLLAGDLFSSRHGQLRPPLFTKDMSQALQSGGIVEQLQPKRLEVCHGDAVLAPAQQFPAYRKAVAAKFSA